MKNFISVSLTIIMILFYVPNINAWHFGDTSLYNETIAFTGNYDGNSEIYYWNGTNIIQVTDNDNIDGYPSNYEGTIAWACHDGEDFEICYWDGFNTAQITNNSVSDSAPSLYDGECQAK
jgi:hypothetical protein